MTDKKLSKMRVQFVERVNEDVIGQLVDDLRDKAVLNPQEAAGVKVSRNKYKQARELIDNVQTKGPKASKIFLQCLLDRDSFLAEELSVSTYLAGTSVCLQVPPIEEIHARSVSAGDVRPLESKNGISLCPRRVFEEIQAKEAAEIYAIGDPKTRTRLALIICNIDFAHCPRRNGAEVDLQQMTLLLEGLGYKVEPETNLTSKAMADCLKRFAAREEHKASDSTFLVLMSHGVRQGLCGVQSQGKDSDILPVDAIFSAFNNRNCPALFGKPKVVIIQACRGENEGVTYVSDREVPRNDSLIPEPSWSPEGYEQDAIRKVHVETDFICLYSSTPDNVSWRSREKGSVFIIELIKQIQEHAWNCNLEEVFRKVLKAFVANPLQMPSKDRTTLTKKFYLFPGH
ncbi:caspase-1-like [Sceloporus undulatus]|uniref:caspase-1-like n=1 Tax=Sceloporus undulatus TaxID=8520 RepID=UPI001C4DAC8F|nr:caspase-1-like [Sceloporus undulatus]